MTLTHQHRRRVLSLPPRRSPPLLGPAALFMVPTAYVGRTIADVFVRERDPLGWVLKALREAGGSLVSEFSGLDEETLCQRPAEGEFCLKEIACHLRDSEELASRQIATMVDRPGRPVPNWDVDAFPIERDYRAADVREALGEFRELRRETTYLLWGLNEQYWRRPGRHPFRGEITIEMIAKELAQHDLEHLWQVRRLKDELGARVRVGDDWEDW
jgi:hypothetical protein